MSDFFRAHQAIGTPVPTYFIESTAPDNVDDTAADKPVDLPNLTPINSDQAVRDIATALVNGANPNLVVMVHGFNNPEPAVLATYTAAAMAIARDRAVSTRQGLVCVGYRWPSEKMGQPIQGTWDALPTLPTWILYLGAALAVLPFLLFYLVPDAHWPADMSRFFHNPGVDHVVTMAGLTFAGLVLTAALLRTIVYFRDNYRASNYGVPDLVQIIRAIDTEIVRQRGGGKPKNDVELSFIGHSMGGFVVTNTIRVLSDVFVRPVRSLSSYGAGSSPDDTPDQVSPNIGNAFSLKRRDIAVEPGQFPGVGAITLRRGLSVQQ